MGADSTNVELLIKWAETGTDIPDRVRKAILDLKGAADQAHGSIGDRLGQAFSRLEKREPMMAVRQLRHAMDELLVASTGLHGPLGRIVATFSTLGLNGPLALGVVGIAAAFAEMGRSTVAWTNEMDASLAKLNTTVANLHQGSAQKFQVSTLAEILSGEELEKGSPADVLSRQIMPQQPSMFSRMGSRIQGALGAAGNWLYGMSVPDSVTWRPFSATGDVEQAYGTQGEAARTTVDQWRRMAKEDEADRIRAAQLAKIQQDQAANFAFGEAIPGLDMDNPRLRNMANRMRLAALHYVPGQIGTPERALLDGYTTDPLVAPRFGSSGIVGGKSRLGIDDAGFGQTIKALLEGLRTPVEQLDLQIRSLKQAMEGAGIATKEEAHALDLLTRRRAYLASAQGYSNTNAMVTASFGFLGGMQQGGFGNIMGGVGGLATAASGLMKDGLPLLGAYAGPIGVAGAVVTGLAALFSSGKAKVTIDNFTEEAIQKMKTLRGEPTTTQFIVIPAGDDRSTAYRLGRLTSRGVVARTP